MIGDGTAKVWEFGSASCIMTLADHSQAVWDADFHCSGLHLATASLDHTIRLWDLELGTSLNTLRGHVDSVNSVSFLPFSSTLLSSSGDKTLSLWDGRTGLCVQTLYGHNNAINHATSTCRGDSVLSCDADGVVRVWDVRMVREVAMVEVSPHGLHQVSVDRSGERAVVGGDDRRIVAIDVKEGTSVGELLGHEDSVQVMNIILHLSIDFNLL